MSNFGETNPTNTHRTVRTTSHYEGPLPLGHCLYAGGGVCVSMYQMVGDTFMKSVVSCKKSTIKCLLDRGGWESKAVLAMPNKTGRFLWRLFPTHSVTHYYCCITFVFQCIKYKACNALNWLEQVAGVA